MKSITKKITIAGLGAICALTLGAGILVKNNGFASADEANGAPNAQTFFYDYMLDENNQEYTLAKKFYNALAKMNETNDFKDGVVDYPIGDIVTSNQLKAWVDNGNLEVPRAFGAARDAFKTDHPELFYIDFYKMTISVARSNGTYVGYINCGKESNLYYDNGFNTPAKVAEAIEKFDDKVDEVVDVVNERKEQDVYTARDAFLAKEVNKYLTEIIKYDYVAYDNKDDPNYIAAAYVNTAYGGLVEGKAVCGGYSTAYKVVMDRLGIPCITVNGYSNQKDQNGNNAGSNVYHMWNYVWLETPSAGAAQSIALTDGPKGEWYSVDVTWDYSARNKYRYALLNDYSDKDIHVTDGVISSSGYRLRYPALSSFTYGGTGETDGLQTSRTYSPVSDGSKDDYGNPLMENYSTVSYNGKSAKRLLEEDGLYLVCRFAYHYDNQFAWSKWLALESFREYAELGVDNYADVIQDTGTETRFYENTSIYYTQFAVFDAKPDVPHHVFSETLGLDKYFYFEYSDDLLNHSNALEIGDMLVNLSYGTYTPPPYVMSSNPTHQEEQVISDSMRDSKITEKVVMSEKKAFVIEATFDEPLHVLDETKPIGISFVSEHPNTKDYALFYPLSNQLDKNGNKIYVEIIEKPKSSNDPTLVPNTLRFKFAPSLLYEHNREGYHFIFTNVGSAKKVTRIVDGKEISETSNKAPNSLYYSFGREVIACPAFFNYDGRLYIDCCAQPTLVSQTDLSAMNFEDENGKSTFSENERSQMMLVAERASDDTVDSMVDEITSGIGADLGIDKNKTETYDIKLQMCNKYPTISPGSYVKIALGFPEGYGPDDKGVTFKIFHRKNVGEDEYIIEEIPCVVTQFGIVATVTSFSPYMVAVVDADKATDKTIYASIEGKGGTLSKADGKIIQLKEGESHVYTIQPNKGYQIHTVTLNGKDVKSKIQDGKLTLGYADLEANNQLVIQYISNEAAARIQQKIDGNEIDEAVEVAKYVVAVKDQPVYSNSPIPSTLNPDTNNGGPNNNNTAIIIISVVCGVVVVAAVATAVVLVLRKKEN